MRAANACWSLSLFALFLTGCGHFRKSPQAQAQAPPLQTGKETITKPDTSNPPVASSPLASPLPPPSAQNVPLPPPPPPRKAKHHKSTPKPPDTTAQVTPPVAPPLAAPQAIPPANVEPPGASPIGQITAGADSAYGERTKRETADLIAETQQGLAAIKRALSAEEQVTAGQIRTFLKQAEQAMLNGDMDGAHTLATKSKLLLDELTKP